MVMRSTVPDLRTGISQRRISREPVTTLTHSRQAYLDAYIQYQLAVADLKRQTLYDFENERSLVVEESSP